MLVSFTSLLITFISCIHLCDGEVIIKAKRHNITDPGGGTNKWISHVGVAVAVGMTGVLLHSARMRDDEAKRRQEKWESWHDTERKLNDATSRHNAALSDAILSLEHALAEKEVMKNTLKHSRGENKSLRQSLQQVIELNEQSQQQVSYWRSEARAAEAKFEHGWRKSLMTITEETAAGTTSAIDESIARIEKLERQTHALQKTFSQTWRPVPRLKK